MPVYEFDQMEISGTTLEKFVIMHPSYEMGKKKSNSNMPLKKKSKKSKKKVQKKFDKHVISVVNGNLQVTFLFCFVSVLSLLPNNRFHFSL